MTTPATRSSPPRAGQAPIDDWRGLGDLIELAVERITAPVEGMHRAMAARTFSFAGRRADGVGDAYQTVTAGVYGTVRAVGSVVGTVVASGAAAADRRRSLRPLWQSERGRAFQASVNAFWGDELERRQSPLRIDLALRDDAGEIIPPTPDALARAFPTPTARLAVLAHGLNETERCWSAGPDGGMGVALAADGWTVLKVRYNTGRHISDNGRELAAVVEDTVAAWPVPVTQVAIAGHSMGGLLARSAVLAGWEAGHRWSNLVEHIVTVGTPHLGAPLEKGVNLVSWGLRIAPESRPLSGFLEGRSAGIKDLRDGRIHAGEDEEATGNGPTADVKHHFVAGVITADAGHPIGHLVGDLMVRVGSGTGRGRRRTVEATNVRVLAGTHHFALMQDPAVHAQVREWLAG